MTNEEAINHFKALLKDEYAFDGRDMAAFGMAIKALDRSRWIPTEKEYPEKDGDYLVCYEQGYMEDYGLSDIGIASFEVDCESFGYWHEYFDHRTLGSLGSDWERIPVKAWMPLPEPYRAESEGSDAVSR